MTLLVGAGFGVVVVALNHAESTPLRSLSLITGGGAGWATFGILMAAWWRRRLVLSIAAATFALAAAVAAYYVVDEGLFGTPLTALYLREMRFWILGALVVGPPLGLVGWRARRDDTWLGVVAVLIAPLGFAVESAIYLHGSVWLSPLERATRLTIIGATLAMVAVTVGQKLTGPVDRPANPTT